MAKSLDDAIKDQLGHLCFRVAQLGCEVEKQAEIAAGLLAENAALKEELAKLKPPPTSTNGAGPAPAEEAAHGG